MEYITAYVIAYRVRYKFDPVFKD